VIRYFDVVPSDTIAMSEESGIRQYDELPEVIKGRYSPTEFMWLSDREKMTLIQRECEPEA
jgi:hypothetical protein